MQPSHLAKDNASLPQACCKVATTHKSPYGLVSLVWSDCFLYCLQYKHPRKKGSGTVHIGNLFLTPTEVVKLLES